MPIQDTVRLRDGLSGSREGKPEQLVAVWHTVSLGIPPHPLQEVPVQPSYPDPNRSAHEAQVQLVLEGLGGEIEPGPPGWETTGIEYFVRRRTVLVDSELYPEVRSQMRDDRMADEDDAPPAGPRTLGLRRMGLRPDAGVLSMVRDINDLVEDEVAAPEYLLHLTPSGCCPADEPTPVPPGSPPDPPVSVDRNAGAGVRVVVLDTGFDPAATALSWMRDVTGDPDAGVGQPVLPPYTGHGTFIAGLVRAMAPRAEVIVRQAFGPNGVVFERDLVRALSRTLREDQPDVIGLSAGTSTESARGPRLLNAFHERVLRRHKGVVLVAAAGNDGWRRHFWPAASPWAVGVGALGPDWHSRAAFSNHGGWVDVYAPGQHLVNAYTSGTYEYREPPRIKETAEFSGMANWSGTSFATPLVAGLIAARMSRTGENSAQASAAVLAEAQAAAVPGVGAVLVP